MRKAQLGWLIKCVWSCPLKILPLLLNMTYISLNSSSAADIWETVWAVTVCLPLAFMTGVALIFNTLTQEPFPPFSIHKLIFLELHWCGLCGLFEHKITCSVRAWMMRMWAEWNYMTDRKVVHTFFGGKWETISWFECCTEMRFQRDTLLHPWICASVHKPIVIFAIFYSDWVKCVLLKCIYKSI